MSKVQLRPSLVLVGGFEEGTESMGGVARSCRTLQASRLGDLLEMELFDAAPNRGRFRAVARVGKLAKFLQTCWARRHRSYILFCSSGLSLLEKGVYAWGAKILGGRVYMFPRGGKTLENSDAWVTRWLARFALAPCDGVLCQGEAWVGFAVGVGMEKSKCHVIHNWTATEELIAVGRKREAQRPELIRLLFVGAVEASKGIFDLLRAIEGLSQVSLSVVGDGSEIDRAKEMVGAGAHVAFLGRLEGDNLLAAYRNSDILVHPSWREGFPNSVVEALAARLAVVCTSVGNIPDVLVDRVHCLMVPPRSPGALRAAIVNVVGCEDFHHQIASAGHEFAKANLTLDVAVRRIFEIVSAGAPREQQP